MYLFLNCTVNLPVKITFNSQAEQYFLFFYFCQQDNFNFHQMGIRSKLFFLLNYIVNDDVLDVSVQVYLPIYVSETECGLISERTGL